ncbi:MAG: ABC transporter substrate-binding protein [Prevotella sp.]|nr:ABC transporter substrate-binding protein [Prevotella sp.]
MKTLRVLGTLLVTLLLAGGCQKADPAEGKMIFRYNESAGVTTLDPAYSKNQSLNWVCTQLYNGLVQLDHNLEPQPAIAKHWKISEDGRTYTFVLRDDVYFHKNKLFGTPDSTRKVVAEDFVYSLGRILDPKVASPGLWIFNEVEPGGFVSLNDSVLQIRLKHPFSPFLGLLSMPYCSVVPREIAEYYGEDFGRHPCGTGPFFFRMWKEGVKLVLRRNELYFEHDEAGVRMPYLDAVAVTFIIDRQTAFLEFVKGNLDFMNSLDASYKDEVLTRTGQLKAKYANRLDMVSVPFLNTEYLGFKMDKEDSPLRDKRVRQAVNMGFDRVKMMKYLRNGIGTPGIYGFIPKGLPGFDTAGHIGYGYDPARASQLLEEAGYPHGQGLPTLTLSTTANYLDLCKYIQQQLELVGIPVKVEVSPPAALSEQVAQGKSSWFRKSWIADYPDAENYLSLFFSGNFSPDGPNYTHFSNPLYDELFLRSRQCSDDVKRTELYRQMDSILMQEAPVVVLYYDQILHFTHKGVSGLQNNALNGLDLRRVKIEKHHAE